MSDGKERLRPGPRNSDRAARTAQATRTAKAARTAVATYARLHREIGIAAPHTIAHRTGMIAAAFGDPAAAADPEFRRMVQEKVQAGADGALAAVLHSSALLNPMMTWAGEQMRLNARLASELTACRLPIDLWAAQLRYSQDTAGNAAAIGSRVSEAIAEVLVAGTRPMHRAATANARRLRRKKAAHPSG